MCPLASSARILDFVLLSMSSISIFHSIKAGIQLHSPSWFVRRLHLENIWPEIDRSLVAFVSNNEHEQKYKVYGCQILWARLLLLDWKSLFWIFSQLKYKTQASFPIFCVFWRNCVHHTKITNRMTSKRWHLFHSHSKPITYHLSMAKLPNFICWRVLLCLIWNKPIGKILDLSTIDQHNSC